MRGEPPQPAHFGPVVSLQRRFTSLSTSGSCEHSPGVAPLCSFVEGSHRGGLRGQHHGSGVSASPRGEGWRTLSPALNREAQLLVHWVETLQICLVPQFIWYLSHWDQIIRSKWTLAQDVESDLQRRWPVMIDLFATVLNYCLPVYFSLLNDPMAVGTDAFLQLWDHL